MKVLLTAVLLSGAIALSCGDEESAITAPTPAPTASAAISPSPTEAPTARATPIPGTLPTLDEALAGGETLAQRPLARPNLIYGIKEGKHVRVFERDVTSGAERLLLEYDEDVEAKHSGNLWAEEVASLALSDLGVLVYVRGLDVHTYNVPSGRDTPVFQAQSLSPTPGGVDRRQWVSDEGATLCCAYHLARPLISTDGSQVVFDMSQWEGDVLGIVATDGSSACVLPADPVSGRIRALHPVWGPQRQLVIPASGEYSANGLYVSRPEAPCSPNTLSADEDPTDLTGFETAGWSPDGSTVAASFEIAEPPAGSILLFSNGEKRVLLDHSLSYWPLYSKDGRYIYYIQRTARLYYPGSESIWRYDMHLGEPQKVAAVPEGWSLWLHGWTGEEYLVLRAQSSNAAYWSTDNRVVLLDPETGGVVYASTASDFTTYAGFLP